MEPRKLHIGLALAMSWLSGKGWRQENSDVELAFDSKPYIEMAQLAEKYKLDFVFRPDAQFLMEELFDTEPGFSSLDPMILLATVAEKTRQIGLISTASTTLLPPYHVARQLQSLQWLSQGRAGWNIVTAIDGHENYGMESLPSSSERYEKASEFLNVVEQLWGSFPADALIMNKESGYFAIKSKVKPIKHHGHHLKVKGPLNLPTSPYGRIPYFQAGASEAGRGFAAKVADAVFAATPDVESGQELRANLRERAVAYKRDPDSVKVLPGISLYLAETKEKALELYHTTHRNQNLEKRLQYIKETIELDLTGWPLHKTISAVNLPNQTKQPKNQTHTDLLRRYIERESPTLEQLVNRPEVIGSSHWLIIGTADDAYNEIIARVKAQALDGFIAIPGGAKSSMIIFFEQVIPKLVQNGWFKEEYMGNTLTEHLGLKTL